MTSEKYLGFLTYRFTSQHDDRGKLKPCALRVDGRPERPAENKRKHVDFQYIAHVDVHTQKIQDAIINT
jgi:hypothetical protein